MTSPDSTASDSATTSAAATPRLACVDVTVRFGGLVAVDSVSLKVDAGKTVGLVGPNGAGKSTLFGAISGLVRPQTGSVLLDGVDITGASPQERARRGLGRTFQHPELFIGLTVRDHFVLAYRVRHSRYRVWADLFTGGGFFPPKAEERARIDELIELVGLESLADQAAVGLPLGTSRLVELGRALATDPTILLLDEPSSGLTTTETIQFEETVRRVAAERQTAVLLVEHDVELVMRMCSSIHVLDFGVKIAEGTPQEVAANPAFRSAYLGEATADTAEAQVTVSESDVNLDAVEVDGPTGRVAATGEALLRVESLSVSYGDAPALSGLSFEMKSGEVLAVLGTNGAGKSTLARALSGLVPSEQGSIWFRGEEITSWPAHRIRLAGTVHLPEGRGVFRQLTVTDNLRMAASCLPNNDRRATTDAAFDMFPALAARRRHVAGKLSGGEQQMLSLARALATSPTLLIADELSLGLAPAIVDVVFEGLERARSAGVTIVLIEQYAHRALGFADRCLVLQRGQLAWQGPSNAVGTDLLRHYLGEAVTAGAE